MDLWKLPKYDRTNRLKQIDSIKRRIQDLESTIERNRAWNDRLVLELSIKKKSLERLMNL